MVSLFMALDAKCQAAFVVPPWIDNADIVRAASFLGRYASCVIDNRTIYMSSTKYPDARFTTYTTDATCVDEMYGNIALPMIVLTYGYSTRFPFEFLGLSSKFNIREVNV